MKKVIVYYAGWSNQTIITYLIHRNNSPCLITSQYHQGDNCFYDEMAAQKLLDASFEVRLISDKISYFTFRSLKKSPIKLKETVINEIRTRYPQLLSPVTHYQISPLTNGQYLIRVWVINQKLVDQVKELFVNFKKVKLSIIPNQQRKVNPDVGTFLLTKISHQALEVAVFDKGVLIDNYVSPFGLWQLKKGLTEQKFTSDDELKTLNRWWLKPEETFQELIDHQKLANYQKIVNDFMQQVIFRLNLITSHHDNLRNGQIVVEQGIFTDLIKSYQDYFDLKKVVIC